MAIDSLEWEDIDPSSCCQGEIQPRSSHRLDLIRDDHLICHNRRAYETLRIDTVWEPDYHTPDRGIGLSGAQMLNNLQLIPPAVRNLSPFRDNLVHLNISRCQSINKSAIDTLLRLSRHGQFEVHLCCLPPPCPGSKMLAGSTIVFNCSLMT